MTSRWPETATDDCDALVPNDHEELSVGVSPRADGASRYRVPAAARTLALLEMLADEHEPQGVSAIAPRLGLPKASCFALLTTLEQAGYVRRDERDEWTLTLRIYHVGISAAQNIDILVVAEPI